MRTMATILVLAAVAMPLAVADTIYMRSGVRVTGKVQSQDDIRTVVMIGKRKVVLLTKEVSRVEENEKTGGIDRKRLEAEALKRDAELTETTGLTRKQRNRAEEAMTLLGSGNREERAEGRRILLAMAEEVDILRYLEWLMPSMLPWYVPGTLLVMTELQPGKMPPILREFCTHEDSGCRAMAIEILGKLKDRGAASLIARGLADHEGPVRISACHALAALGVKEATPALIENLRTPDPRVQNASRTALHVMWNVAQVEGEVKSAEAWQAFWEQQSGSVSGAFALAALEPLVAPGTCFIDE